MFWNQRFDGIVQAIVRDANKFVVVPDTGTVPLSTIVTDVFTSLRFFWSFIHMKDVPQCVIVQFNPMRELLLLALAKTDIVFANCWHYLSNHLLEDFENWGPMFFLLGEGNEASHALHNRMKVTTLKERQSENDAWNTWSVIMRNFAALRSLVRGNIFNRCVPPTSANSLSKI